MSTEDSKEEQPSVEELLKQWENLKTEVKTAWGRAMKQWEESPQFKAAFSTLNSLQEPPEDDKPQVQEDTAPTDPTWYDRYCEVKKDLEEVVAIVEDWPHTGQNDATVLFHIFKMIKSKGYME
jgi:hypothetical protein